MAISLENYSLYEVECTVGGPAYLLTCVYNPAYPNWLGPAETWSQYQLAALTNELLEKFAAHMASRGVTKKILLGEWPGGMIESAALGHAEPFSKHRIWYSMDTKYPPLFVFEVCDTESEFWESIKELELAGEGIDIQNLTQPAKQLEVYYLSNQVYRDGGFPYENLGRLGWKGS